MPIPFAIVGPGRLGGALARRWHDAGLRCVGFVGRDAGAIADALAFVGAGRPLEAEDLRGAAVVALTVSDGALATVARDLAAAGAVRSCALWLHTSGLHGVEVLAPLRAAGARIGALHPLAPVPDRARGLDALAGCHALVDGPPASARLLRVLAERAGMRPVEARTAVDRALYHAACALAANGVTAAVGVAADLFAHATGVDPSTAASLAAELAGASCRLVAEHGAVAALSGPVLRGDHQVVREHLAALAAGPSPAASGTYRQLMRDALRLARARGLAPEAAAQVGSVLDGDAVG